MTATKREPVVIEITDDAYKENSVYRPWDETRTSAVPAISGICLTPHQVSKMLASVGRELAAAVMSG